MKHQSFREGSQIKPQSLSEHSTKQSSRSSSSMPRQPSHRPPPPYAGPPPPYYQQSPHDAPPYGQAPPPYSAPMGPPPQGMVPMPSPMPAESPFGPPVLYLIEDVRIRHWFIFKVYMILFAQLAIVAGATAALLLIQPAREWMTKGENYWMYIVAVCLFVVIYLVLVCCERLRREWPCNFICLIIFTLATAYMTAVLASHFSKWTVLIAAGITAGTCLVVSLFALQTWVDFTKCTGVLCILTLALIVFGIVISCIYALRPDYEILNVVYSGIAAILFVGWLAIDTQMLLGNKTYALTVDDYIFAALQLFVDIVYIFWHLLIIIGHIRGE